MIVINWNSVKNEILNFPSMTIIEQEKFAFKNGIVPPFSHFRREAERAIADRAHSKRVDEEKKRLLRTNVTYDEFKNLVSTVHLKPVSRRKLMNTTQ